MRWFLYRIDIQSTTNVSCLFSEMEWECAIQEETASIFREWSREKQDALPYVLQWLDRIKGRLRLNPLAPIGMVCAA